MSLRSGNANVVVKRKRVNQIVVMNGPGQPGIILDITFKGKEEHKQWIKPSEDLKCNHVTESIFAKCCKHICYSAFAVLVFVGLEFLIQTKSYGTSGSLANSMLADGFRYFAKCCSCLLKW